MTGPAASPAPTGRARRAVLALLGAALGAALGAVAAAVTPGAACAQPVDPRGAWVSVHTPHLRVHVRRELLPLGLRAAREAEGAWAALARDLVPPRGPVDLVVTDNADVSQGFASTFPTNRVVVFARPPVDEAALRFSDDWLRLVIVHELAHLFHLDRARGPWRLAQRVFGRHPAAFPNQYGPAWLSEGLAVHAESRVTGAGRLVGTEHRVVVAAAARDGRFRRLDELSIGSSAFPGGLQSYAYGSLLVDRLASAPGSRGLRALVDAQSAQWNPFRIDRTAERAFGTSFSASWRAWRDSIALAVRADDARRDPREAGAWRLRTTAGWYAAYPRWLGDTALLYAANDARSVSGVYRVPRDGPVAEGRGHRVGRRNSLAPNVLLRGGPHAGGLLFTQLDYADPFTIRSDLWVQRDPARGDPGFGTGARGQRRLTRGARLLLPDARADGAIVAVQLRASSTRLVRVTPDGRTITALTTSRADTQWTEPRWAPDGARVAAVRTEAGAVSAVVVLDTLGRVVRVAARERGVLAAPAWSADGATLVWASDRRGGAELYALRVDDAGDAPRRVSDAASPLLQPALAPGAGAVAAMAQRGDGYHLAVRDGPLVDVGAAAAPSVYPPAPPRAPTPALPDSGAHPYRPWRTLVPRWWTPVIGQADGGATLYGLGSNASDPIDRNRWSAQLAVNGVTRDVEAVAIWRSQRLGLPVLDVRATQGWLYDTAAVASGAPLAPLTRRVRTAGVVATFARPRVRTNASLAVGASMEWRGYGSPEPALRELAERRLGTALPLLTLGGFWTNARRPLRSISPEDGVTLAAEMEQRWGLGEARETVGRGTLGGATRGIGVLRAFRSLDLPGFAHHVVAVRLAGAAADRRAPNEWSAGGVGGSSAQLLPGVTLGDPARPLGVRGFPAGAQRGLRAASGALEYRAPLAVPARGLALLPVFLDRVSASAFVDAASAWCPASLVGRAEPVCSRDPRRTPTSPRWMASVGAELVLDGALQYDPQYRLRLGVAAPVAERELAGARATGYVTLGLPF